MGYGIGNIGNIVCATQNAYNYPECAVFLQKQLNNGETELGPYLHEAKTLIMSQKINDGLMNFLVEMLEDDAVKDLEIELLSFSHEGVGHLIVDKIADYLEPIVTDLWESLPRTIDTTNEEIEALQRQHEQ